MITVSISVENGVQLTTPVSKTLAEGKIIWATAEGSTKTKLLYAKSLDRRDRPDELIIDGTPASWGFNNVPFLLEASVAVEGKALAVVYYFNPGFIEYVYAVPFMWNGTLTNGFALEFTEGAFLHKKWFLTEHDFVEETTTTTPEPEVVTTTTPEG